MRAVPAGDPQRRRAAGAGELTADVELRSAAVIESLDRPHRGAHWCVQCAARFHNYRWDNRLLITAQRPGATRLAERARACPRRALGPVLRARCFAGIAKLLAGTWRDIGMIAAERISDNDSLTLIRATAENSRIAPTA
ncbi:MAG: hypothetical protein U0572_12655 [Phycisphaerales bacterium]